jgi:hypothetical protein
MTETMHDDATQCAINDVVMNCYRDYIARILGPSPFDFRGRHLMSKKQAEETADEVVAFMESSPDKGLQFMKSLYAPDGFDG